MENALPIDPQNVVVRYCAEGIQLEQSGQRDEALRLFTLAWDKSTDAFERTIAAHYLARHQTTPEEVLHWNQEALSNADAVGDDRVREFYPSLYLNLGKAHEDLGTRTMLESSILWQLSGSIVFQKLPTVRSFAVVSWTVCDGPSLQ